MTNHACQCGCGESVKLTRSGRPNTYVHGHALRGVPKSDAQKRKQSEAMAGKPGPWLGKTMPADARSKMSAAKRGGILTADHRMKISIAGTGRVVSEETRAKMRGKRHSLTTRAKMSAAQRGELGSGWKGGISTENERIRASAAFRDWRLAVYRRDAYTCQDCGAKHKSGCRIELHAHHILPFALFPEHRLDVDNGATLCKLCHDKRHGRKPQQHH